MNGSEAIATSADPALLRTLQGSRERQMGESAPLGRCRGRPPADHGRHCARQEGLAVRRVINIVRNKPLIVELPMVVTTSPSTTCCPNPGAPIGDATSLGARRYQLRRSQGQLGRTVDLSHSSDGSSWIDLAENRPYGIILRGSSQPTSAIKSAPSDMPW